ncbi:MAG TPA: hypothetical protein VGE90_08970 [Chitinophaga sp.]
MKKNTRDNIKAFVCLIPLILLIRMTDRIPWWSFVILVSIFGILTALWKWKVSAFATGFLAGLVVWIGASIYYHMTLGGTVLNKIGVVLFVPGPVVILISGVIGGLLTGLALYTGRTAIRVKEV